MFSSHLVFFFLGLAEDARIVCPAAVGLHGPRHSHAGHQDHRHGQDEADAEEVAGVAEAVPALPVRGAAHPGGLRCKPPPAEEGGQGGGQSEAGDEEDAAHQGQVGGQPLLVGRQGHDDVPVQGEQRQGVAAAQA